MMFALKTKVAPTVTHRSSHIGWIE